MRLRGKAERARGEDRGTTVVEKGWGGGGGTQRGGRQRGGRRPLKRKEKKKRTYSLEHIRGIETRQSFPC